MKGHPNRLLPWLGFLLLGSCAAPGGTKAHPWRKSPRVPGASSLEAGRAPHPAGAASRPKVYRERIEWIRAWIPDAHHDLLPRVLLVGDSITQGYYGRVAGLLSGKAYVGSLTTSLSVCDPKFPDVLKPVLESFRFSVIHFNNGIHGPKYSLEAYRRGLDKTFRFLREKAKGAKIVWASTTPVRFRPANKDRNTQIRARNRAALELARKYNLPVDDLYALSKDLDPLHRDDYHYKPKAIQAQARAVARFLERFIPKRK